MQSAAVNGNQVAWWRETTRVAALAEFLIYHCGGEQTAEKQQYHF
jgi:hypothetical protein